MLAITLCLRKPYLTGVKEFDRYAIIEPDEFESAANYFQSMQFEHPDYSKLAVRILLERIYIDLRGKSFAEYFKSSIHIKQSMYMHIDINFLNTAICPERDYNLSFVALKTLMHSYLLRENGVVTESPQYFFMRCAICVCSDGAREELVDTYHAMSTMEYIHSSATLFNACKYKRYYSSCFVMSLNEDNIFDKMPEIRNILLSNGGLGVCVTGCSPAGPYNGCNPRVNRVQRGVCESVLAVLNAAVNSINPLNRRGSVAVYLDVWHADVLDFIMAKMPHGDNTYTELFYGLNVNNMFMECVIADDYYHLIDPNTCPELVRGYSKYAYNACVESGNFVRKIKAREILTYVIRAQGQSGVPYLINIEQVNNTTNHKNIGKILCGNLCTEIFQYHDDDETAVCNLASANVSAFVRAKDTCAKHAWVDGPGGCGCFDFGGFERVVKLAVRNLNRLIDVGEYPSASCKRSNVAHRPLGMGIQGLFDALQKLGLVAGDPDANDFNASVMEHAYHYSLEESATIAEYNEKSYESFGQSNFFGQSDFSRGILQFDYYSTKPRHFVDPGRWNALKKRIAYTGIANSLLTACMPTATVSNVFGTSEGVEPYMSNVYIKSLQSGNITIVNPNLMDLLVRRDMYNRKTFDEIIKAGGSVANLAISDAHKRVFRTAHEIEPRTLQEMARDRSRYVDQGQSLNIFIRNDHPDAAKSMIQSYVNMYKMEMKNIVYYLFGEAPARPMDPTTAAGGACHDESCCQ